MQDKVDTRYWRFCLLMGPVFFAVRFVCAGVPGPGLPPFAPDAPPADLAGWFRGNVGSKRLRMVAAMAFAPAHGVRGYGLAKMLGRSVDKDSILVRLARVGAARTRIALRVPSSVRLTAAVRPCGAPAANARAVPDGVTGYPVRQNAAPYPHDTRARPPLPSNLI